MDQPHAEESSLRLDVGPVSLEAELVVPAAAGGLVVFAHGSGSSRHSPRNRHVAAVLRRRALATLLMDLLTPEEDAAPAARFDIELLAERLVAATDWIGTRTGIRALPVGYFGASTGAAAALIAAAARPARVTAIVSRGGRPDLAGDALPLVQAPTLLVVGGRDEVVLELNQAAFRRLRCPKELVVVPGATHLFEEAGALDEVARLAADWFERHAQRRPAPAS